MRKGLFAAAFLAGVLTFSSLVGCTTKKDTYEVAITNKEEMQADWLSDAEPRTLALTIKKNGEEQNATKALQDGTLKLVSSAEAVAKVVGRAVTPVAAGQAKITVTYGTASDNVDVTITQANPHGKTADDPLTVQEAIAICLEAGETQTTVEYYIKGYVSKIGAAYDPGYGNITIYIADTKTDTEHTIDCYRAVPQTGVDGTKISLETEVLVSGYLLNYGGNTPELATGGKIHSATGGKQAETHTVTTAEALAVAKALPANSSTIDIYVITGYIVNVVSAGTFYMHDDKGAQSASKELFEVYGWNGDNKDQLTLDAKVRVTATLKHYVSSSNPDNYAYETDKISSIEILEPGVEPEITLTGATALTAAQAGVDLWAGALQTTINKVLFVNGQMSNTNFLASDKLANAANVRLEEVTGGYNLKVGSKYINLNSSKKLVAADNNTDATVWKWSSVANSVYAVGSDDANYFPCAYSTYNTFGASKESYVIADGAVKAGQFPLQFYAKEALTDPTELQLDQKATAVAGVPFELVIRMNPYNANVASLNFTSSDETVATVAAGGIVTPLKAGTTTITAKFGTTLEDECVVTVAEVNLGSEEHPLTVAEALAACETLRLGVGQFSPKLAYVTGVVELEADAFYNNTYFGKWNLKQDTNKLYVANSNNNQVVPAFEGDTVVASGYLSKDSTKGFELLKNAENVYPKVLSVTTRGTSTVTVGEHANATVSNLSATSGANLSEVTFQVAPDSGYAITKVSASSVAGEQVLEEAAGVYTLTIKGNMTITVTTADASATVVSISVADLPAFYESSSTSTTEHTGTAGGMTIGVFGAKTASSQANADAGTKYSYIMLMGGAIYNKTTLENVYIAKVVVTYTGDTGTSGRVLISLSAAANTARDTGENGTVPEKNGTLVKENSDKTLSYFNISNQKTNNTQVKSIEITFKAK